MRILLAHNFYRTTAPSGEDIAYSNEKEMLSNSGLNIATFEKFNDDLEGFSGLERLKLGLSNSWSSVSYRNIKSKIQSFKPDIVHFHNTFPQITPSGYAACKDMGIPVIQTLHNFRLLCANALLLREGKSCELCVSGSMFNALKYKCYRNSLSATASQVLCLKRNRYNGSYANNVDRYITLTKFAEKKFIEAGFSSEQFVTRPNFLPDPPKMREIKQNYAIFVGRVTEEKGVYTLLNAWKKTNGIELRIVGDGELLAKCKKYVDENNINVRFMGYLSRHEVIPAIQDASFMILPSNCYEGFPISLLEAFACGTPIIVSNIGGQSEIIKDGVTGLTFEVGNSGDLADVCSHLSGNAELLKSLRVNARKEFERMYTRESVFQQTLDIYNSVLS
ncbi:MAG: glycosyltransferase family 4 protein [Gammaproteobacteria bacterium]|nr:glycosyltransferase family 4 protein [Gammaproteobacteria bacterium]